MCGWMRAWRSSCRCCGWSRVRGARLRSQHLQEEAKTLALAEPAPAQTAGSAEAGTEPDRGQRRGLLPDQGCGGAVDASVDCGRRCAEAGAAALPDDKLDSDPKEFQRVLERSSKRDLGWFFDDWVYRDRGLPDLSIASVTPRALDQIGNKGAGWLVAVEVRNDGDAAAEVPVTVRSGTLTSTQQVADSGSLERFDADRVRGNTD